MIFQKETEKSYTTKQRMYVISRWELGLNFCFVISHVNLGVIIYSKLHFPHP